MKVFKIIFGPEPPNPAFLEYNEEEYDEEEQARQWREYDIWFFAHKLTLPIVALILAVVAIITACLMPPEISLILSAVATVVSGIATVVSLRNRR